MKNIIDMLNLLIIIIEILRFCLNNSSILSQFGLRQSEILIIYIIQIF